MWNRFWWLRRGTRPLHAIAENPVAAVTPRSSSVSGTFPRPPGSVSLFGRRGRRSPIDPTHPVSNPPMPTVLIAPGTLRGKPGPFREILRAAGFDEFLDPVGEHTLTEAELRLVLPGADAMLAGSEPLTAEMIALAPRAPRDRADGCRLRRGQRPRRDGPQDPRDHHPGHQPRQRRRTDIRPAPCRSRRVAMYDRLIKAGGWPRALVMPLRGKTMGLVGLGRIGRAVASRAVAFGMTVAAFDPLSNPDLDARLGVVRLGFEELLAAADVVSLHLPLTRETRGLFGRDTLAGCARFDPPQHLSRRPRGRSRPLREPLQRPPRRRRP